MEVNKSYIAFLLQLINREENIDINKYQDELIVNLYLTLLSLSNLEYNEDIEEKEKSEISDFLRKLNNLKVKIQLKRKPSETNKLAEEIINQYYENINILSIYIKDGIELENIINTMDAKSLTKLIDTVTKNKMNKEDRKIERNRKRSELVKLLPTAEYYINNSTIYIKNNKQSEENIEKINEENIQEIQEENIGKEKLKENIQEIENKTDNEIEIETQNEESKPEYEEIKLEYFIEMFSYLLNPDNYRKTYKNKSNQKTHDLIISNIIKILLDNKITIEELNKILVPILLTYSLSLKVEECNNLDTSEFNIENIKINELYSFAKQEDNNQSTKMTKWHNITIPNEYLLEKIKEMIKRGMYYHKEDTFVLEHIENNASDFRISIKTDRIEQFLKNILEVN